MNSYLFGNSPDIKSYNLGAMEAINKISSFISDKELEKIKQQKLQFNTKIFRESQYLQSATELTICSYFANHFPHTFKYENKVNPPKDVDCSFEYEGMQFNIEVKCADFTRSQKIRSQDGIHLDSIGRLSGYYELENKLNSVLATKDCPIILEQNMDNKLKDSLKLAHEKFSPVPKENHLNILVVSCDTPRDLQKWVGYMLGSQGLFTEHSYINPKEYNLVDYVVLSNIYHRHYNYVNKNKISNHWEWEDAFNLAFLNPFRQLEKIEPIQFFTKIVPNFSKEYFNCKGLVDSEGKTHSEIKLLYLVEEIEKKNNIFYFQPSF